MYFRATLTDRDGEIHLYHFACPHLWYVTEEIYRQMALSDFYGHDMRDTIQLEISALVAHPGGHIITLPEE